MTVIDLIACEIAEAQEVPLAGGWPLAECNNCEKPIGDEEDFRWRDACGALVCPRCWAGVRRIDGADIKLCDQCRGEGHG